MQCIMNDVWIWIVAFFLNLYHAQIRAHSPITQRTSLLLKSNNTFFLKKNLLCDCPNRLQWLTLARQIDLIGYTRLLEQSRVHFALPTLRFESRIQTPRMHC
jgi:hypothetical protein